MGTKLEAAFLYLDRKYLMNPFNQVVPTPVQVPQQSLPSLMSAANSYIYNLPGTNQQGVDLLTHLEMNIRARLNLEWCSRTLLSFSNSASFLVSKSWVLDFLLDTLTEVGEGDPDDIVNSRGKDSALVLRNLVQDVEFTQMLALSPRTKKVLYQILNKYEEGSQDVGFDNELLFYIVEVVENVSSYYAPCPKDDELFLSLVKIFEWSNDRSLLISIMRSFARFLVRSQLSAENCSSDLNSHILDKVTSFLLVDDFDLILTSLDLLYQFTLPGSTRISHLLKGTTRKEILRSKTINLLTYQQTTLNNPNDFANLKPLKLIKRTKPPVPTQAPKLSPEHFADIANLNEPLRATAWMRSCYRPSMEGEVTQISLWKSYESQFDGEMKNKKKLLPAVDFIKNVNHAFVNSSAMVINLNNGQRKFIIKGIEPRFHSVDKLTADYEALNPSSVGSDNLLNGEISTTSQQEPLAVYSAPSKANDVNKSAAQLLTNFITDDLGKEVFRSKEEEIFAKSVEMPSLFGTLGYLS